MGKCFVFLSFSIFIFCVVSTIKCSKIRSNPPIHRRHSASRREQQLYLDLLSGRDSKPLSFHPFPSNSDSLFSDRDEPLDPRKIAEINALVGKDDLFQSFQPGHMEAVQKCSELLAGNERNSSMEILQRASDLKQQINLQVWINCVIGRALSSSALAGFETPALVEISPDRFIPLKVMEMAANLTDSDKMSCVVLDERIGEANGIENSLWYFREDTTASAQHWYWHIHHTSTGPIRPNRRGELFYYFHHSMLARYNSERLSNGLPLTIPLRAEPDAIIEEAYYTYLTSLNSKMSWSSRQPNQPVDFNQILRFVPIVYDAIDAMTMNDGNSDPIDLRNLEGIDILGDAIERYLYSIADLGLYGNIHNLGHVLIAGTSEDGENGVMGDTTTAMRDIVFYRWHSFINSIYERHKALLPVYSPVGGDIPLVWTGVQVTSVEISSQNMSANSMQTFWSERKFDISRGLDLRITNPSEPVSVCSKHLDHQPFDYTISIEKANPEPERATIRIFLAPRFNNEGARFSMEEQRKLFFVLDTFSVELNQGNNIVTRNSEDSSLTKPFSKTFAELEKELESPSPRLPECGCGWPHHLLIPKGNEEGMAYDLFVMVTNGVEDSVGNIGSESEPDEASCRQPYIYCGIRDQDYPDMKPMGFPFDRRPPISNEFPENPVKDLDEFVGSVPNSKSIQVTITHTNSNSDLDK